MSVSDEVRREVDELIDRLSRDEVLDLLTVLLERFAQENEELRGIYREENEA
jgi:hypothetical protein